MSLASMKVDPVVHDALRRLTFEMSAEQGRRLKMSDVMDACVTIARAHRDELRAALAPATATPTEGTQP